MWRGGSVTGHRLGCGRCLCPPPDGAGWWDHRGTVDPGGRGSATTSRSRAASAGGAAPQWARWTTPTGRGTTGPPNAVQDGEVIKVSGADDIDPIGEDVPPMDARLLASLSRWRSSLLSPTRLRRFLDPRCCPGCGPRDDHAPRRCGQRRRGPAAEGGRFCGATESPCRGCRGELRVVGGLALVIAQCVVFTSGLGSGGAEAGSPPRCSGPDRPPHATTAVPLRPDTVYEWLLLLTPAAGFAAADVSREFLTTRRLHRLLPARLVDRSRSAWPTPRSFCDLRWPRHRRRAHGEHRPANFG